MSCLLESFNITEFFQPFFSLLESNKTIDIEKGIIYCSEEIKNKYGVSRILCMEIYCYLIKFKNIKEINNKTSITERGYSLDFIMLFLSVINYFIRSITNFSIRERKYYSKIRVLEKYLIYFYGYNHPSFVKQNYEKNNIYSSIYLMNVKIMNILFQSSPTKKYRKIYFS